MTSRRKLLKAGAALTGAAALGFPAIVRSQSGPIRLGHLVPLTGFLGALGESEVLGMRMALEEINKAGGVMGRQLEVLSEDSVNPATGATKAQRMYERDGVPLIFGEINSAVAKTIMQVAARNKKLFMQVGARSDALRGADCNRYTFHVDIPVTVMVNAAGQALLRDGLVKGKKYFSLTSDYLFGHDLAKAAKNFMDGNGAKQVGNELVATDLTDFSPFLLKIRQANPDIIASNLAGNQVTNFIKQYAEYGLKYPIAGYNLNTMDAWAAGDGNLSGIWPTVWHHELTNPGAKAFVAEFRKRNGRPPDNHAWISYVTVKILAQGIAATKGTDTEKLIAYYESQAQFDILKARKGYFRSWDHQLIQEAYPFTVKPKGQAKDKYDFLKFGAAVPAANQSMEILNPTKEQSACKF